MRCETSNFLIYPAKLKIFRMKKIIKHLFTFRLIEVSLVYLLGIFPENSFLKWLRPWCIYYPRGSLRHCERAGVRYCLDISDYQEWSLYFHSSVDSSLGVLEYLSPGMVVLDVGGNIGQTAMPMALKVGSTGQIYSFEPFPCTYQKFLNNLSLNEKICNVRAVNLALGAEADELHMNVKSTLNSGENSIVRAEQAHGEGLVSVSVSTIDTFFKSAPLSRVDFIKIDVEGFELDVLKGASQTLNAFHPSLFIELDDGNLRSQGSSAAELCNYLMSCGYYIREHGKLQSLSPTEYGRHMDIYCLPVDTDKPV